MMPERRIDTEVWSHPDFQPLSYQAKFLYIYTWTNEHCNAAGIYRISLPTIAFETGLPSESLPELLKQLECLDVKWFPELGILWIVKFLKHQSRSPKFLVAVAQALRKVNNPAIIQCFLTFNSSYNIPYRLPPQSQPPLLDGMDTLSIPSLNPQDTVTKPSNNGHDTIGGTCTTEEDREEDKDREEDVDTKKEDSSVKSTLSIPQKLTELNESKYSSSQNAAKNDVPYADICALWNQTVTILPKVRVISEDRISSCNARWRENGKSIEAFKSMFQRVETSDFLSFRVPNKRGWVCTLDWILIKKHWDKALGGEYDNYHGPNSSGYSPFPGNEPTGTLAAHGAYVARMNGEKHADQ